MIHDVLIRDGLIAASEGLKAADVGIRDEVIAAIGEDLPGKAVREIQAAGCWILPGGYDSHVHFNDPGRPGWETSWHGSRALAAGGFTMYSDMPLNSIPLTLDGASFDAKLEATRGRAFVDYSFWGGLTPDNLDKLEELAERGVVGFKAFLCNSGIDEFRPVDQETLYRGLRIAAQHDLPVFLHAEDEALINERIHTLGSSGGYREFLATRPEEAETRAVEAVIETLRSAGGRVHIAHVSSPEVVRLVARAKHEGLNITLETVPQYLAFDQSIFSSVGGFAKSCPPIRSRESQEELWKLLLQGDIDSVSSDHSPSDASLKQRDNFFEIWGGVSGCQSTLNTLISEGVHQRRLSVEALCRLIAGNPRKLLRMPGPAFIEIGSQADLTILDPEVTFTLREDDLYYKNQFSLFTGMRFKGQVQTTLNRGHVVYDREVFSEVPEGRFIRPTKNDV
ncbi:allantoinase AllB [Clostridiaceae bacterium HFYG-1003]|nr:allantoinase AllB [Clostridiaceae bacterium HFYG-1003]